MNIGDRLYCHTNCVMKGGGETTTVGRFYIVIGLEDDSFMIKNDDNDEHFFEYDDYNKWFWDIRELRKNKLKQINECRKNIKI